MHNETMLGKLIEISAARDAIHVACAPMIADCDLVAAEHVGIVSDGVAGKCEPTVGIVDPFLSETVLKGQKFWLVLCPGTVTAIRHHWSHPSFRNQPEDFTEAREWITAFAAQWKHSFDDFMEGARVYLATGRELDSNWEHQEDVPDEQWDLFWRHFRLLTGASIREKEKVFVICCPN